MKQQGCLACPRNEVDSRRLSPKMQPAGPVDSDVYFLAGAPTEADDASSVHLKGSAGALVWSSIPRWSERMGDRPRPRVSYAVRCRGFGSKGIGHNEVACCSKYADEDIARCKPVVVVGFGEAPLRWALGGDKGAQDTVWRGRLMPIKAGNWVCWYYHMQSPSYIVASEQNKERGGAEDAAMFEHDMHAIFNMLPRLKRDRIASRVYVPEEKRAPRRFEKVMGRGELDIESVQESLNVMRSAPYVGFDIETSALRPYGRDSIIATASFSTVDRCISFPIDHPEGWPSQGHRDAIKLLVADFLANSGNKVVHSLGFEQEWVAVHLAPELLRRTQWEDSMAAAHTLDERRGALKLGMVTQQRFGFDVKALSNIDTKRLMQYPLEQVLDYNGLDAYWCLRAFLDMREQIQAEPQFVREYERKIRTTPTLVLSQVRGVHADAEYAAMMGAQLTEEIKTAERLLSRSREVAQFEERFGRPFKVNDDDVVMLLRDVMGRDEGERGKTYSGDESVLSSIPASAGIAPQQILAVRGASKLLGTYITPILNRDTAAGTVLLHDDGLIHTNYNLMTAVTGRLSSDDPNMQNYPKRKRREVRGVIVTPDKDRYVFCAFDYGQLEARVIAMASEDKTLVDSMWTSYDIHAFWAERFVHHYPRIRDSIVEEFGVDWDDKGMKTLRQEAKNKWVFPMFFGSSFRSCAKGMRVPEEVAQDIANEFWDTFDGVRKWQKRTLAKYEKNKYVETLTGRRRHGPMSMNEIINTPIQGTGSDIVTDAQNRLSEFADATGDEQFQPPINVHDDLSFYIPRATMVEDVEFIARTMCDCRLPFINVPVLIEASLSQYRWHEMTEIGIYRSDEFGFHKR